MGKQEIYDAEWYRKKFKKKGSTVMSAADYQKHISKNPLAGKKKSTAKDYMEQELKDSKLPYVRELRFSKKRRFRFDWAIQTVICKIGIEYDGIFAAKSRHTTVTGFSKDQEKTNLAQAEGWVVLRYSPLNYKNMMEDVLEVMANLSK